MQETAGQDKRPQVHREDLGTITLFLEIVQGVGVMFGLGLLALLELIRNAFFDLLDRFNFRPRRRKRASAFPPGRPRRHRAA